MRHFEFVRWAQNVYVSSSFHWQFYFGVRVAGKMRYVNVQTAGYCIEWWGTLRPARLPKYVLRDALAALDDARFFFVEHDRDGNPRMKELRYCEPGQMPGCIATVREILTEAIQ